VIGLIYLVAWVVARWQRGGIGPGRRQQEIRLVESRFLGPKKSLILVEVAGERLLLATSGQEITLLKELGRSHAPPDEEKDDFQPMAPFSDQFAKVVNTLPTAVARPLNGFAALLARKRNEHAVAELQEESEELLALEDERLNRLKSLAQWRWQR
jgi:flagellar protein FliO/FliZ